MREGSPTEASGPFARLRQYGRLTLQCTSYLLHWTYMKLAKSGKFGEVRNTGPTAKNGSPEILSSEIATEIRRKSSERGSYILTFHSHVTARATGNSQQPRHGRKYTLQSHVYSQQRTVRVSQGRVRAHHRTGRTRDQQRPQSHMPNANINEMCHRETTRRVSVCHGLPRSLRNARTP